jgi:hypothetical protein
VSKRHSSFYCVFIKIIEITFGQIRLRLSIFENNGDGIWRALFIIWELNYAHSKKNLIHYYSYRRNQRMESTTFQDLRPIDSRPKDPWLNDSQPNDSRPKGPYPNDPRPNEPATKWLCNQMTLDQTTRELMAGDQTTQSSNILTFFWNF